MASVNKTILLGNLGRDPELRTFPDGGRVCNATLATSYSWKDRSTGEKKEETEWHRLVFRDRLAEIAGEYLKKGSSVYVEGRIKNRKWTDKEGKDQYTTEILVDQMQLLGGRADDTLKAPQSSSGYAPAPSGPNAYAAAKDGRPAPPRKPSGGTGFDDMDDDIPF